MFRERRHVGGIQAEMSWQLHVPVEYRGASPEGANWGRGGVGGWTGFNARRLPARTRSPAHRSQVSVRSALTARALPGVASSAGPCLTPWL